jgi:hypothetical protein
VVDKDVLRLYVAVDDFVLLHVLESLGNFFEDEHGLALRKLALLLADILV